jgi:hypothetical protein
MNPFVKKNEAFYWSLVMAVVMILFPNKAFCETARITAEIQSVIGNQHARKGWEDQVDSRGWVKIDGQNSFLKDGRLRFDMILYGLNHQKENFFDGEAVVIFPFKYLELTTGLFRESWGRLENSPLDVLGPSNTIFSLVNPQLRLSQKTIKARFFLGNVTADFYGLTGRRPQPLPDPDRRFGFGVPTNHLVENEAQDAHAVRISSTLATLDWALHYFSGISPRPTFIPEVNPSLGVVAVAAVYNEIVQWGGELETTVADWRFAVEGFSRSGQVNALGGKQTYQYYGVLSEYQLFGMGNGTYDLIVRLEGTADTREDKADIPFASSGRFGMRVVGTSVTPMQIELSYLYDWILLGYGATASIEKKIGASEQLTLGAGVTYFSNGETPSVLDRWEQDFEINTFLRVEI